MKVPDHMVALFDPASPASPRLELRANFNPHEHTRWDHRPAVLPVDFAAIISSGEGGDEPLLAAQAVAALAAAGVHSLKDVLRLGEDGLRAVDGLTPRDAKVLQAWASSRHAAPYALAELTAEAPAVPVVEGGTG